MRVITGSARGRTLITLDGGDVVRPTTDRVKEAMFSILQFELEGRRVLDLFAGSGQLGIEALSRGAEKCTFIDSDMKAVEVIQKNLEHTRLKEKSIVLKADSLSYIRTTSDIYDIVIIDPPYGTGQLQKALALLDGRVAAGGVVVCEMPYGEELPEAAGGLTLFKRYKYGKTELAVYR
ncbi:MAG: 16S rRNA (guanine(966)-N(2))-methyltransferase RsmD [Clostridia bacterium]|nr:16S rRNA (guanine(966)-N(2))-methyltransferase RsmD [Clostridia bacterium]MBR6620819.1 16S rRNA (guanine(966)-N(2))-methyltransferase RsmD [Clostridia bacterium]